MRVPPSIVHGNILIAAANIVWGTIWNGAFFIDQVSSFFLLIVRVKVIQKIPLYGIGSIRDRSIRIFIFWNVDNFYYGVEIR